MPGADLQGIIPALVTPLDERSEIDEASIHALIDFQIAAGVNGLFVLGSTGEGPLLSTEQKLRVIRSTVDAARGPSAGPWPGSRTRVPPRALGLQSWRTKPGRMHWSRRHPSTFSIVRPNY